MDDLLAAYKKLVRPEPTSGIENFTTATLPNASFRIGKDPHGNPVLLIPALIEAGGSPIHLEHLDVRRSVRCRVSGSGKEEEGTFTIIRCVDADEELATYFLRSIDPVLRALGPSPTSTGVTSAIEHLVELFRALTQPPIKSVSGLWAELFLIRISGNPRELMRAWHTHPQEKYDFNAGDQRIEVKSTSGRDRVHHFSLEQLNPSAGTRVLVASIFMEKTGGGTSLGELVEEIRAELANDSELEERLNHVVGLTLGNALRQGLSQRFDRQLAKESLKIFDTEVIPKIPEPLPSDIFKVHFQSDLDACPSIFKHDLERLGGLFAELKSLVL